MRKNIEICLNDIINEMRKKSKKRLKLDLQLNS